MSPADEWFEKKRLELKKQQQRVLKLKMNGLDIDSRSSGAGLSGRMEEAMCRLTLALEELDENRREEELFKSMGANWKKIARVIDRFLFCIFLTVSIINTCV